MSCYFFFNDTATTEIYTLSLHDALPISTACSKAVVASSIRDAPINACVSRLSTAAVARPEFTRLCNIRSEEHTSELQSRLHLVCRLLLEKKKQQVHSPLRVVLYGDYALD